MRLSVEASSMYGNRSGVGRYALEITKQLAANRPNDSLTLFNFLRPGRRLNRDFEMPANTHYKYISWFPGRGFSLLMRHGIALPMEIFGIVSSKVNIFPVFISWASLLGQRRICVIHDLAYMLYPDFIQGKNLAYMRAQVEKSITRSTMVVAVSHSTKNDIMRFFGTPEEKIRVVPNGVDLSFFKPATQPRISATRKLYNLPEKYMLFLGNVEPRKNISGLLEAYAMSYPKHKLPLIVGGGRGWNDEAIQKRFDELSSLPIIRLGYVDETDMPALYSGATMFVYPSQYEGFGIPVLEAMATGCPVICADNSSFPEVVGNAAIMVASHDCQALAGAMSRLASDKDLQTSLSNKGLRRVRKFTWEAAGKQMSEVVDEAANT